MIKLTINSERCKACGLCIAHCPKELLQPEPTINEAGPPSDRAGRAREVHRLRHLRARCVPDVCFTICRE